MKSTLLTAGLSSWPIGFGLLLLAACAVTFILARVLTSRRLGRELEHWRRQHEDVAATLSTCRHEMELRKEEARNLQQALLRETESRAAHEQRAKRVPVLEDELIKSRDEQRLLRQELTRSREQHAALITELKKEKEATAEKIEAVAEVGENLQKTFQALATEALKSNNELFLNLARSTLERHHNLARTDLKERQQAVEQLIRPLSETLSKYEQNLADIERARQQAYVKLSTQTDQLGQAHAQLLSETAKLAKALGRPQVRGRWGELTLKRVVELAGMTEHCDFETQLTVGSDHKRLRPDLVIRLPGVGRRVVAVDAKAPLQAYLSSFECTSEQDRTRYLKAHCQHIKGHLQQLASKNYWNQFEHTPEFVVLFLPGESFFSAALEQDPELIEKGVQMRVILATPTTLIALLKAVAYGWKQHKMSENAARISDLGKELYTRISRLARHLQELGRSLNKSIGDYNKVIGTFETRMMVSARHLSELGAGTGSPPPEPEISDRQARMPASVNPEKEE